MGSVFPSASRFTVDPAEEIRVTGGGGAGSNVNISGINGSPPAMSNPLPVELSDGTNPFGTPGNPLTVNVASGGGSNASVGVNNAASPASSTQIGSVDAGGKLQAASFANPLPVEIVASLLTDPAEGFPGAAPPAKAIQIAGSDGNALRTVLTDAAGRLQVTSVSVNPVFNATQDPDSGAIARIDDDGAQLVRIMDMDPSDNVQVNQRMWGSALVAPASMAGAIRVGPSTLSGKIILQAAPSSVSPQLYYLWNGSPDWQTLYLSVDNLLQGVNNLGIVVEGTNTPDTGGTAVQGQWSPPTYQFQRGDTITGASLYQNPVAGISIPTGRNVTWEFGMSGYSIIRLRISAFAGTGLATLGWVLSSYASTPSLFQTRIVDIAAATDGTASATTVYGSSQANPILAVGAFANTSGASNTWAYLRTPNIFKTVTVAATVTGNSAVWTPAAGKKFRLMRFQITAQGLAATATGVVTVSFQDSASGITVGTYDVDVPAVAGVVTGVMQISPWVDLGNGFLSAAANNVLNFNISAAGAGTVGSYRINTAGTEE